MAVPLVPVLFVGTIALIAAFAGKKTTAAPAKRGVNVPGFPVVPEGCGPSGELTNPYKALVDTALAKETDPNKLDELANAFDTSVPPCPVTAARIRDRAGVLRKPPVGGGGTPPPPKPSGGSGLPAGYFPVGRKEGGFDVYRTPDDEWWIFPGGFSKPPAHIARDKPVTHPGFVATSRKYVVEDEDGETTEYQIWVSDKDNKDYIFVYGAPVPVKPGSGGFIE